ncbi:MAG TPA: DUF2905 domain-containing protein [Bdellovibrionales bacterium]|nr:DUF2905 domain-containing protein [Bdellovibrionales bacterium]
MANEQIGKTLIIVGLLIAIAGVFLVFQDKLGFLKHLGRLPGDISVERDNFKFYFPLATSIIVSLLLTLLLSWLNRR